MRAKIGNKWLGCANRVILCSAIFLLPNTPWDHLEIRSCHAIRDSDSPALLFRAEASLVRPSPTPKMCYEIVPRGIHPGANEKLEEDLIPNFV